MPNPPWYDVALREIGVKEVRGPGEHPRILQYHTFSKMRAKSEEVPWCASFVNFCLETAHIRSTRSAAAASYATWGEPVMAKLGAVVVFGKADPDAGGTGHVAFFSRWDDDLDFMWVLGGNQSNMVCVARRPASRVVAIRWPRNT